MKYTVCLENVDSTSYPLLKKWLKEKYEQQFFIQTDSYSGKATHIKIFQISELNDWLKVYRLMKRQNCFYILLLDQRWQHTSPLAIRLQAHSLVFNPVKKSAFIRSMDDVLKLLKKKPAVHFQLEGEKIISAGHTVENEPLENYVLRQLLHQNIQSENVMMDALSIFKKNTFPNAVCYVEGFAHLDCDPADENHSSQLICSYFNQAFTGKVSRLYFIPLRKSMLVLFRQPESICSLKGWQEGRKLFERIIEILLTKHRIQIYIGVGSLYNDPHLLHHSFKEAEIARSLPPFHEVSLRYYEEISKEPDIKKSTVFIHTHFGEEMTARDVARHVNLSYSHFIRLFKKETGNNFSEYVTFVRLRNGVRMLRQTGYTIEEIADMTGFNTPNYFSSTFKKFVGATPRDFRLTKEIVFA
ncbi:helix-turn-helix domain-containing protein [Pseudobacillus wudalianchiensis]|uniref:HTH araC/xylS-type domain-containing protein n=1 Tax=Pseudobacillus wudalianchiensis TaxID=1743143 RepID=A0A1B9AT87_9BACI|nr:helix-turn-helix domain-containing protein [Bacillus wudalianchiensis]OCA87100.1 hypothetical protein A8F95_07440 [Bacillus wudalianchiensis]